jgi:hypothetical protein
MEDNDKREFSWQTFFFVSGFSCFAFSGTLKILDGSFSVLFLWVGAISILLGLLGKGIQFLNKHGKDLSAENS